MMDHHPETFNTWNKIASIYEERFMFLDIYNESYDRFCELMPVNAAILDVACGPGNITKYLSGRRPDLQITGIDIAPNMIELAKKHNPAATFKIADIRDLGSLGATFDGIICGFGLPFLSAEECKTFMANASGILNEKGIIYLSFMEGDPSRSGYKTASTGDRTYFYYHDLELLKKQLGQCGFAEPVVMRVDYKRAASETEVHTILIAKKESR